MTRRATGIVAITAAVLLAGLAAGVALHGPRAEFSAIPDPSAAARLKQVPPAPTSLDESFARSRKRFEELVLSAQGPPGDDALAFLAQASALIIPFERGTDRPAVDFQALAQNPGGPDAQAIRAAIAELEAAGAADLIAKAAAAPRAVPATGDGLLFNLKLPQLGHMRQVTRFNVGRAAVALARADHAAFVARISELLAIGAHASRQGNLLSHMVAVAVQARAFAEVQRGLASASFTASELDSMRLAIERHPLLPISHALAGEQLLAEDFTEFVYFTGPDGLVYLQGDGSQPMPRPATRAIAEGAKLGDGMPDRATQLALIEKCYAHIRARALMTPAQRRADAQWAGIEKDISGNLVLGAFVPSIDRALWAQKQFEADRAGAIAAIALFRCHASVGGFPASLQDLVPEFLAQLPTDPYTGGPIGYLPPRAGGYPAGRHFVLYAAGPDGADDGGKVDFNDPFKGISPPPGGNLPPEPGHDFLLNREAPVPK